MNRINAAALGAALLIGIASAAGARSTQAQGVRPRGDRQEMRQHGRRGSGRDFGGRLAKDLNLTDAQKAQIKTIHEKYKSQFEGMRTQLKSETDNARALRQKGDTAGARAAFQKARADIRARMEPIRQREQGEIRNVLTAEQRTKFDAAQAQRKKMMEERQTNGGPRGKYGRHQRG